MALSHSTGFLFLRMNTIYNINISIFRIKNTDKHKNMINQKIRSIPMKDSNTKQGYHLFRFRY